MFENRWTEDISDMTARFIVRGYFSGDGQHWYRVYDRETGLYDSTYAREVQTARDKADIRVLVEAASSPVESINAKIDAAYAALRG